MKRLFAAIAVAAFLAGFVFHGTAHADEHASADSHCVVCHVGHASTPAPAVQSFNPIFTLSYQVQVPAPRVAIFLLPSSEASRAPPAL